ncbi:hypothetical protein [Nocardiopsis kunsanensis]|uniref:Aminoglycoside phosphotransferase n=1 Tax=Nocardiopsis kunsanensis TaxID=141693 RepID=A0A918XM54_9ACTN|nr:hypothetical protein [Nocardiopsis kunsanensis]GHD37409.1 hypothetical protein GCM10007147_45420 [Nocardiopsis kunsanensis]
MDEQILRLITPHAGKIQAVKPTTGGHGAAMTALVETEQGRLFVKATPNRAGGNLDAARREAAIGPHLGDVAPAFRFQVEDGDWFVVGADALDARASDFTPESEDLPTIIDAVDRVSSLGVPDVAARWVETRWDRFATEREKPLLRGRALTHADVHGRNVLIDGVGRGWVVDWDWPTLASSVVMPTSLAVQLVSAGHSPESAQAWVAKTRVWGAASSEERRMFAAVNARMHDWLAELRGEEWLHAMAKAAHAWSEHMNR